jgi:hypothetical protein
VRIPQSELNKSENNPNKTGTILDELGSLSGSEEDLTQSEWQGRLNEIE